MFKVPTLLPIKASVKNGNIQRRLAWSLGKDDTHSSRKSRKFFFLYIRDSGVSSEKNSSDEQFAAYHLRAFDPPQAKVLATCFNHLGRQMQVTSLQRIVQSKPCDAVPLAL